MKCPECSKKITDRHYDAEYEWYECPGCEGCFTESELVQESKGPKAKGKKRAETLDAEQEALAEFEAKQMVPVISDQVTTTHHRDEVRTKEVVNIMADEIMAIYEEDGYTLNEVNAQDKALTIWREALIHARGTAREQEVDHKLCEAHA